MQHAPLKEVWKTGKTSANPTHILTDTGWPWSREEQLWRRRRKRAIMCVVVYHQFLMPLTPSQLGLLLLFYPVLCYILFYFIEEWCEQLIFTLKYQTHINLSLPLSASLSRCICMNVLLWKRHGENSGKHMYCQGHQ